MAVSPQREEQGNLFIFSLSLLSIFWLPRNIFLAALTSGSTVMSSK